MEKFLHIKKSGDTLKESNHNIQKSVTPKALFLGIQEKPNPKGRIPYVNEHFSRFRASVTSLKERATLDKTAETRTWQDNFDYERPANAQKSLKKRATLEKHLPDTREILRERNIQHTENAKEHTNGKMSIDYCDFGNPFGNAYGKKTANDYKFSDVYADDIKAHAFGKLDAMANWEMEMNLYGDIDINNKIDGSIGALPLDMALPTFPPMLPTSEQENLDKLSSNNLALSEPDVNSCRKQKKKDVHFKNALEAMRILEQRRLRTTDEAAACVATNTKDRRESGEEGGKVQADITRAPIDYTAEERERVIKNRMIKEARIRDFLRMQQSMYPASDSHAAPKTVTKPWKQAQQVTEKSNGPNNAGSHYDLHTRGLYHIKDIVNRYRGDNQIEAKLKVQHMAPINLNDSKIRYTIQNLFKIGKEYLQLEERQQHINDVEINDFAMYSALNILKDAPSGLTNVGDRPYRDFDFQHYNITANKMNDLVFGEPMIKTILSTEHPRNMNVFSHARRYPKKVNEPRKDLSHKPQRRHDNSEKLNDVLKRDSCEHNNFHERNYRDEGISDLLFGDLLIHEMLEQFDRQKCAAKGKFKQYRHMHDKKFQKRYSI